MKSIGTKRTDFEELLSMFAPTEGANACYYGKTRNGKTYNATADIIDLLMQGEVVYANWMIDFKGFDERNSFSHVLMKTLSSRSTFFNYSSDNFHYFHPDEIDIEFLGRLVNVHLFIDEGQWIFNSKDRDQDIHKRKLILHGGHYCRTLNIITQRPVNIYKDIRSQINFWYKCEKIMTWPFLMFQRSTFEDMVDDLPDESEPDEVKVYFAKSSVFNAYNTHAMRAENAIEVSPDFEAYDLSAIERLSLLGSYLIPRVGRKARGLPPPAAIGEAESEKSSVGLVLGDTGITKLTIDKSKKQQLHMDIPIITSSL